MDTFLQQPHSRQTQNERCLSQRNKKKIAVVLKFFSIAKLPFVFLVTLQLFDCKKQAIPLSKG